MHQESRNQNGLDEKDKATKTKKFSKKIKIKSIRVISGSRIKEGILSKATISSL
jgi:hypothetical protein